MTFLKGAMVKDAKDLDTNKRGSITKEKDYCDLLYAWLQCNSEKVYVDGYDRRIEKNRVKWTQIERDFTRRAVDGSEEKIMGRKTIAKYFQYLLVKFNFFYSF